MFKDLFLKFNIRRYLKKLNNQMLSKTYLDLSKIKPKTHIENVYIKLCIEELKKRKRLKYVKEN